MYTHTGTHQRTYSTEGNFIQYSSSMFRLEKVSESGRRQRRRQRRRRSRQKKQRVDCASRWKRAPLMTWIRMNRIHSWELNSCFRPQNCRKLASMLRRCLWIVIEGHFSFLPHRRNWPHYCIAMDELFVEFTKISMISHPECKNKLYNS